MNIMWKKHHVLCWAVRATQASQFTFPLPLLLSDFAKIQTINIFLGVLHILASFIFLVIFQQKSSSWDLILCFFYTLSWIFNRAGTKCVVPVSSYVQFCPKLLDGNVFNTTTNHLNGCKKTFFKGQLLNIVMFCLDNVK